MRLCLRASGDHAMRSLIQDCKLRAGKHTDGHGYGQSLPPVPRCLNRCGAVARDVRGGRQRGPFFQI